MKRSSSSFLRFGGVYTPQQQQLHCKGGVTHPQQQQLTFRARGVYTGGSSTKIKMVSKNEQFAIEKHAAGFPLY